jgi:release factor glutamine methyltransferase
MEHIGYPLHMVLRDPGHVPAPPIDEKINGIVADIHKGLPIQYILGSTMFFDLKINVDERVLIPRPETEEMIELMKSELQTCSMIMDLGTGSGCIALALKHLFPEAEVWGADLSKDALRLADQNGKENNLEVHWILMDMLDQNRSYDLPMFDLIVSNPPYVMRKESEEMSTHVKDFEPSSALFVEDEDPLVYYRAIATFSRLSLSRTGEVWVEINEQFGVETAKLFEKEGFNRTRILKDIHNKDRYVNARQ